MSSKTLHFVGFFAGVCTMPGNARAEVIGNYIVAAPLSATSAIGGPPANWLNVNNAAVSVNDAFTGHSILDDGYGSVSGGRIILLTFAPGVLSNRSGVDLVLYDADPDQAFYRISTSHDNFGAEIHLASSDFVDTGEDRSYFFGGAGPSAYDISAAEMDLSDLNMPAGTQVSQVRIFTEFSSHNPLGVGAVRGAVPATTAWGLFVLILLVLAAGTVVMIRTNRPAPT